MTPQKAVPVSAMMPRLLKRRVDFPERSEVGNEAVAWRNEEVAGARTGADEFASLQSHATFPQPVGDPRQSGQRVAHRRRTNTRFLPGAIQG